MEKKRMKRPLAFLLALLMVVTVGSVSPVAMAEETGETTEVVLSQWSAEDLLEAANATGTKNSAGNPIYDPVLRDWVIGVESVEAEDLGWVFSNAQRNNVNWTHSSGNSAFTFNTGDHLQVVMYITGSLSTVNTQDQAAGFLSLIAHNKEEYGVSFLITEKVLEEATPAPERGEGVLKAVWDVTDTSAIRPMSKEMEEAERAAGNTQVNSLELRAKVYQGASLAFYGIEVYNITQKDADTGGPKMIMAPQLAKYTLSAVSCRGQRVTQKGLMVYTGFMDLMGGVLNNQANRKLYHAGTESNKAEKPFAVIKDMSLGRIYEGSTTLRMSFASCYTLENSKKFTLKITTQDGKVIKEETVTSQSLYNATPDDSEESYLTDSGYKTSLDFDLDIDSADSGKEFFLSIDTYNSTDLAFFGASLIQEQAAWQAELADQVGNADDGSILLKEWNYRDLATVDGDYTSARPNGNRTELQYTTDAYEGTADSYKVPVGIEYYFDKNTASAKKGPYTSAIVNKDTLNSQDPNLKNESVQGISAVGAFAEVQIPGVSLADYRNRQLNCEMDIYISGSSGWNPWVRVYNSGDMGDGSYLTLGMDVNVNGTLGGELRANPETATRYTSTLKKGAYGDYQYQSVAASKTTPNTDMGGFRNGYTAVWLLVNHYQYTETNTYRVFKYTVKDGDKELFTIKGEDFIQIAENQNSRADEGYTPIRARVLWSCREDAFSSDHVLTVGVGKSGNKKRLLDAKVPADLTKREIDANGTKADRNITPGHGNSSIRSQFTIYAPNGFGGNELYLYYYYKDANGVEQKACVQNSDGDSILDEIILTVTESGGVYDRKGFETIKGNDGKFPTKSVSVNGKNLTFEDLVPRGYLKDAAAVEALRAGNVYFCAEFKNDHDFAAYPIYIDRLRINLLTGGATDYENWGEDYYLYSNRSSLGSTTGGDPKTGYTQNFNQGWLQAGGETTIYPAIQPTYSETAPSSKPQGEETVKATTRYAKDAVRTWLVGGQTYALGEVSFQAIGQYEMNWEVQGKTGTVFRAQVTRVTPQGSYPTVMDFTMDSTEKTVTFPFQVIDITDQYTFSISAIGGDVTLFQGDIQASEVALVGDTVYPSFVTAQKEVQAGQGVELLADVDSSGVTAVSVPADTFLDLRGQTLKVRNLVAFGGVADSKKDNQVGLLALVDAKGNKITKAENAAVILREDNGAMPLFDSAEGGYRFFELALESAGVKTSDNKVTFGYFLKSDHEAAYSLMGRGDSGMAIDVDVRWTGSNTYYYAISDNTVIGFGNAVAEKLKTAKLSSIRTAITLTIGGTNALGETGQLWTRPALYSSATRVGAPSKYEGVYSKNA